MLTYSIGEMIDRLAVTHLKIWHLEEQIQVYNQTGESAETIEALCDQVVSLNAFRMKVVASIDEYFKTS